MAYGVARDPRDYLRDEVENVMVLNILRQFGKKNMLRWTTCR
jgi:hypothetical protein